MTFLTPKTTTLALMCLMMKTRYCTMKYSMLIMRLVAWRSHLFELSQDTRIRIEVLHLLEHEVVGLVSMPGECRYLIHGGPDHMDHSLKARAKVRTLRNISPGIGRVSYPIVYRVTPALVMCVGKRDPQLQQKKHKRV